MMDGLDERCLCEVKMVETKDVQGVDETHSAFGMGFH